MNGKKIGHHLIHEWEQIAGMKHAVSSSDFFRSEVDYRLRKLMARMSPILDMMFIKTIKASDMLLECLNKTKFLNDLINQNDHSVFQVLTEVEKLFESIVKETYEFRIKAG